MPAYNFQARFAPLVETGQKERTIRGREAKIGTTAYLFTGMRTKQCRRLGQGEIIDCTPICLGFQQNGMPYALHGRHKLTYAEICLLAVSDGFVDPREMVDWFAANNKSKVIATQFPCVNGDRHVFGGFVITWILDKRKVGKS